MEFEIIKGNIADVYAEAIVLPANPYLKEGKGASQAIFKKAGRKQLQEACSHIGYCESGDVAITPAFDLSANYILHAVVPKWIDGNHQEYELLSSDYITSLRVADIMKCKSIAFPLLGSGNNGYDIELAFHIAKENILRFESEHIKKIYIVIYGDHIDHYLYKQGYSIVLNDITEHTHHHFFIKCVDDAMGLGKALYDEALKMAHEYLSDENNRRQLLLKGIEILKYVLTKNKEKLDE